MKRDPNIDYRNEEGTYKMGDKYISGLMAWTCISQICHIDYYKDFKDILSHKQFFHDYLYLGVTPSQESFITRKVNIIQIKTGKTLDWLLIAKDPLIAKTHFGEL